METRIINKSDGEVADAALPKIYCLIDAVNSIGYIPAAVAEDGTPLASHCSSSEGFAKHDIGFTSDWKHDKYLSKCDPGFQESVRLNASLVDTD